ncbi:hypothetical protein N4P66_10855, partial [Riemerella anatipestifer]
KRERFYLDIMKFLLPLCSWGKVSGFLVRFFAKPHQLAEIFDKYCVELKKVLTIQLKVITL